MTISGIVLTLATTVKLQVTDEEFGILSFVEIIQV
jgi:hypothetical protein